MKVQYPKTWCEAEVQAALWNELRNRGYDARLEVKQYVQEAKGKPRRQVARFDIVVFEGKVSKYIIEVKGRKRNGKIRKTGLSKQINKYKQYGDVLVCLGKQGMKAVLEQFPKKV